MVRKNLRLPRVEISQLFMVVCLLFVIWYYSPYWSFRFLSYCRQVTTFAVTPSTTLLSHLLSNSNKASSLIMLILLLSSLLYCFQLYIYVHRCFVLNGLVNPQLHFHSQMIISLLPEPRLIAVIRVRWMSSCHLVVAI